MATTIQNNVKNAMLDAFIYDNKVGKLVYQGEIEATTSSPKNFAAVVSNGVLTQLLDMGFEVDTNLGAEPKSVIGVYIYNQSAPDVPLIGIITDQIYTYPNNGSFTVSGWTIEIV